MYAPKRRVPDPHAPAKRRCYFISTPVAGPCTIYTPPPSPRPDTPPARLDALPDELLVLVCQGVSALDKGQCALASLCRANKHLNRVATAFLYASVDCRVPREAGMMLRLVRTPRLARLVRKMVFCTHESVGDAGATGQCASVLRLAANLQHLAIYDDSCFNLEADAPWWDLSSQTLPTPLCTSTFAHLQSLSLALKHGMLATHISFAFRLPSLRVLSLTSLFGPDKIDHWPVPHSSSSIRDLHLSLCFLSSAVVAQMLASIKALHRFTYHYTPRDWQPLGPAHDPRTHWAHNDWADIGTALQPHRDSLAVLKLHERIEPELLAFVYPAGREVSTLGSLSEFSHLKIFAGQIEALLDIPHEHDLALKLPRGLQELLLRIAPAEANYHAYTRALASLRTGVFTARRRELYVPLYGEFDIARLRLSHAFGQLVQVGVRVCALVEMQCGVKILTCRELRDLESEGGGVQDGLAGGEGE